MTIEYSDFLPIWKDFIKDAGCVLNVQMVAHHFYNLGLSAQKPLPDDYVFVCKKCGDEIGIKYEEAK